MTSNIFCCLTGFQVCRPTSAAIAAEVGELLQNRMKTSRKSQKFKKTPEMHSRFFFQKSYTSENILDSVKSSFCLFRSWTKSTFCNVEVILILGTQLSNFYQLYTEKLFSVLLTIQCKVVFFFTSTYHVFLKLFHDIVIDFLQVQMYNYSGVHRSNIFACNSFELDMFLAMVNAYMASTM